MFVRNDLCWLSLMPTVALSPWHRLSQALSELLPPTGAAPPAVQSFTSRGWELPLQPIEPTWILEGEPVARCITLAASPDGLLSTGLWDCTAGTFEWFYWLDETIYVLEGGVVITEASGRVHDLEAGDIALLPAGSRVRWRVDEYVRKFFVVRARPPKPLSMLRESLRRRVLGPAK
jgi:uncharacterized cupin superfamily protein